MVKGMGPSFCDILPLGTKSLRRQRFPAPQPCGIGKPEPRLRGRGLKGRWGDIKRQGENGSAGGSEPFEGWTGGLAEEGSADVLAKTGGRVLIPATLLTHWLTFRQIAHFLTLDEFTNPLSDSTEEEGNKGEDSHL